MVIKIIYKGEYKNMNVQNFPIVDINNICIVDKTAAIEDRAYDLLKENRLIKKSGGVIHANKEKIEILCNEKLSGVIPNRLNLGCMIQNHMR